MNLSKRIPADKRLKFDSHGNKDKVHKKYTKICVECGDEYEGSKQSRVCNKPHCKNASNRAWQARNLARLNEIKKLKNRKAGVEVRDYNNDHMIKSSVIKAGHCNRCGKQFEPESKYAQFCPDCRKLNNFPEIIINSTVVDVDLVIDNHLGEDDGLINIIQDMYPNYDHLQHQTIFDECYQELLKRYGEAYFAS